MGMPTTTQYCGDEFSGCQIFSLTAQFGSRGTVNGGWLGVGWVLDRVGVDGP